MTTTAPRTRAAHISDFVQDIRRPLFAAPDLTIEYTEWRDKKTGDRLTITDLDHRFRDHLNATHPGFTVQLPGEDEPHHTSATLALKKIDPTAYYWAARAWAAEQVDAGALEWADQD